MDLMPPCLEDSLPEDKGGITRAAARVDYDRVLAKQIVRSSVGYIQFN